MNQLNNSLFENIDNINEFNISSSDYLGFIIEDNESFLLPNNKEHRIHHEDSLNFTTSKLYGDYKSKYFNIFKEKVKNLIPDNLCFVDSPELTYSFFLASLNKIVFLNSSDMMFISGLLFVPEQEENLSEYQKDALEKVLQIIPKDNNDINILTIPSIEEIKENNCCYKTYSINEYIEKKHKKVIM